MILLFWLILFPNDIFFGLDDEFFLEAYYTKAIEVLLIGVFYLMIFYRLYEGYVIKLGFPFYLF